MCGGQICVCSTDILTFNLRISLLKQDRHPFSVLIRIQSSVVMFYCMCFPIYTQVIYLRMYSQVCSPGIWNRAHEYHRVSPFTAAGGRRGEGKCGHRAVSRASQEVAVLETEWGEETTEIWLGHGSPSQSHNIPTGIFLENNRGRNWDL